MLRSVTKALSADLGFNRNALSPAGIVRGASAGSSCPFSRTLWCIPGALPGAAVSSTGWSPYLLRLHRSVGSQIVRVTVIAAESQPRVARRKPGPDNAMEVSCGERA
jgi:hypothetical protein